MIKKFGLFGYGGHAREVAAQMGRNDITFFVSDEYAGGLVKSISEFDPKKYLMMIAIANSKERKKIAELLPENTEYFTFIHPTALIMAQDISIGIGSFIGANSIITTNVKIGNHVILNRGNHIGHDTNIGDYFSAMPGSIVSGNVNIGECVYMGTNSSTKEKINICSDVIIGSNTTVIRNITTNGTYVGVPAKFLKKYYENK